ncbi:MFS transporter [Georgenia halophila]|uniref:MFS transporter n=1 Tax=Georgenia halophila TaxID=620889 RepID=A0ABP8LLT2_9MICO
MTTGTSEPLWTRDFVLATIVNLSASTVFYLLMTTLARYASEEFGAGDSLAGLAASMFIVGAIFARLLGGNLIELVGRRRMLVAAQVVFLVASISYLPTTSLPLLLIERFVHGLAFGITSTATITIAQSLIPPLRRGEGTGYFTLSNTVATALGPFLGLTLIDVFGYQGLFWGAVGVSTVGITVALVLRVPPVHIASEDLARMRRFRPRDLLSAEVLPIAVFMGVIATAYAGIITFLDSYASSAGLSAGAAAFFLVYAGVLFVSRLFVGRIQDRRGDNVVVYPAILSLALGLAVLSFATTDAMVVVAGALVGLGFGTIISSCQAIAVGLTGPGRLGVAVSSFYFMVDVGTGFGPAGLGALVSAVGYSDMYLVLAFVVLASSGLYFLVHGRRAPRSSAGRRPA